MRGSKKSLIPIRNHHFTSFPSGIRVGEARIGVDNHAVILLRRLKAHIPFPNVRFHPIDIPFQGIAVSAAGDIMLAQRIEQLFPR